jgi:hypothetical protein
LVGQPPVPLGGDHLSRGAADREEVIILDPSSLTPV